MDNINLMKKQNIMNKLLTALFLLTLTFQPVQAEEYEVDKPILVPNVVAVIVTAMNNIKPELNVTIGEALKFYRGSLDPETGYYQWDAYHAMTFMQHKGFDVKKTPIVKLVPLDVMMIWRNKVKQFVLVVYHKGNTCKYLDYHISFKDPITVRCSNLYYSGIHFWHIQPKKTEEKK